MICVIYLDLFDFSRHFVVFEKKIYNLFDLSKQMYFPKDRILWKGEGKTKQVKRNFEVKRIGKYLAVSEVFMKGVNLKAVHL